jgi:hypothetical protein
LEKEKKLKKKAPKKASKPVPSKKRKDEPSEEPERVMAPKKPRSDDA